MSDFRDDDNEMTASHRLDDATIDALIAGRPVPAELDGMAAFVTSVRTMADQPVEPSARLAAMMASGVFPPDRELPAAAASDRSDPAQQGARSSRRRRTRMATRRAMVAFATRLAGLGALAKTVTVATVAVAAVGTAGAAGALPDAAQDTFDKVVNNEAPAEHPDNFGGEVSEDARDGGVDGGEISEKAKENGNRPDDPGKPTGVPKGPPEHANNPPHPTHPVHPTRGSRPTDVPPGPPEHANNPPLPRPTPTSRPSDVPPGPPEHANNPSARPTPR